MGNKHLRDKFADTNAFRNLSSLNKVVHKKTSSAYLHGTVPS